MIRIFSFLILIIFSSSLFSIEPQYYGKYTTTHSYYEDGEGNPIIYDTIAEVCAETEVLLVVTTAAYSHPNEVEYIGPSPLGDRCHFNVATWNSAYNRYNDPVVWAVGYNIPTYDGCVFVINPGEYCSDTLPTDYEYYCDSQYFEIEAAFFTVCNPIPWCTDYESCYNYDYANNSTCSTPLSYGEELEIDFTYTDPFVHGISCTVIPPFNPQPEPDPDPEPDPTPDPTIDPLNSPSPDRETNGGSGGTGVDDLSSGGSGSTVNPSTTFDDSKIINAIDNQTGTIHDQLDVLNDSINAINDDNIYDAINTQTSMLNEQLNNINQSVNNINDDNLLAGINAQTPILAEIEDDLDDTKGILNNAFNSSGLPDNTTGGGYTESLDGTYTSISTSPVASALNSVSNSIQFSATSTCPVLSIDLTGTPLNSTPSTNIHCTTFDLIRSPLSNVMLVVWSIVAFRIFASA